MLAVQQHVSLQTLNTLAIDSTARYLIEIDNHQQIPEALSFAEQHQLNVVVLGGGSNVVLQDKLSCLIIRMNNKGLSVIEAPGSDNDTLYLTAAAGENWHQLVIYCLQNDWFGLENLALIPGSVGASPIQNIGAYGVELNDVFESLRGWNCQQRCWQTLSRDECQFGYRDSIFKHTLKGQFIICSVTLKLSRKPRVNIDYSALKAALNGQGIADPSPQQVADAVIKLRQSKLPDPQLLANAGSFFKNPIIDQSHCNELLKKYPELVYYPQVDGRIKLAAGWLLEQAGWKGLRQGKVGMHQHQSLVLINYQGASSAEVMSLAVDIQKDIWRKFAVELVIEPALIAG